MKKILLIFYFYSLLCNTLWGMDFETFYQQVHLQSLQKNPVKFRGRNLYSRESYHRLKPDEIRAADGSLVLVFAKIAWFMYFNEISGVGIATDKGSYLQFDIKYYETLQDIGIEGKIYAMCVLPRFDKCILLGYPAF